MFIQVCWLILFKCVIYLYENVFNKLLYLYFVRDRYYVFFLFLDCGGVLIEDNGEILSLNFLNNYNYSDVCVWFILVLEGVKIQVLNFFVFY